MKNLKTFLFFLTLLTIASCQRGCTSISKKFQTSKRDYIIHMYSGGQVVFADTCRTIINSESGSDGIYYYDESGKLIEVSGDYILQSK